MVRSAAAAREKARKSLEEIGAEVVHAGIFDFGTMFRERRLRREDFLATFETAVFANVPAKWDAGENILFPGPYASEPVAFDEQSIRAYPFEQGAAAIVGDYTGPQAVLMPRAVLRKQVERAAAMGYEPYAAFEFEFIVLNETADTLRTKQFSNLALFAADNRCWSGQTAATFAPFAADLEALLKRGGVDIYSLSVELGPGCFEATLGKQPAMRAADDAAFFRMFAKAFCRQRDLTASFMPFLGEGFPGLGGHVSVSLKDKSSGKNVFADAASDHGLSQLARAFLAGAIDIIPDAFPMMAQTVNAYRRFAPGSWAPKTVSWAPYSYAAALRVASESDDQTRIECRLPGADCNVFLTLALLLGAGLDGLEHGLKLSRPPITSGGPNEIPEGVPRLPDNLRDATHRMTASKTARGLFGDAFIDHFATLLAAEDASLRRAVSASEIKRYLEGG